MSAALAAGLALYTSQAHCRLCQFGCAKSIVRLPLVR